MSECFKVAFNHKCHLHPEPHQVACYGTLAAMPRNEPKPHPQPSTLNPNPQPLNPARIPPPQVASYGAQWDASCRAAARSLGAVARGWADALGAKVPEIAPHDGNPCTFLANQVLPLLAKLFVVYGVHSARKYLCRSKQYLKSPPAQTSSVRIAGVAALPVFVTSGGGSRWT